MKKEYMVSWALAFLMIACQKNPGPTAIPWNVLFITIDDLRPELGCYGQDHIHSPNIDQLASIAYLFERAYTSQALCNPARSALLTGMRPQTLRVFDGKKHFRQDYPKAVTLPQLFREHGYQAYSFGKVLHHRDTQSWDAPSWVPIPKVSYPIYKHQENLDFQQAQIAAGKINPKAEDWWAAGGHWVPAHSWEAPDVPDSALFDGQITDKAIQKIREIKHHPFFVAVGFFRPHIPFIAPRSYFDQYPLETINLSKFPDPPSSAPDLALTNWGETRLYKDIPRTGPITEEKARELLRGYYACISYVDAQVGRLIDALEEMKLTEQTMVVLLSDHGYHLGDLGLWGKYTNFEQATRVPLIIKVPGKGSRRSTAIVELIDIFPTLADLCNLPKPRQLEGRSFIRLFSDTSSMGDRYAYSQYPRGKHTGYSVRNGSARFTLWRTPKDTVFREELYIYDMDLIEKSNLISQKAHTKLRKQLKDRLLKTFDKSIIDE